MKKNIMKRVLILVLAAVLLLGAANSALAASSATITASSLNVRKGVGTEFAVRRALTRDASVYYLGVSDVDNSGNIWYKVQYGTYDTGWVSAKYCELNSGFSAVTSYCTAEYGDSYIRSNPNLDGSTLGVMKQGTKAYFLNQICTDARGVDWFYVNYEGTYGWVSSAYTYLYAESTGTLNVIPDLPTFNSTKATVKAEGGDAYIRSMGNLNGLELAVLKNGSSATYMGERSVDERGVVWFRVKYNGVDGWISSRYAMLYGNNSNNSSNSSGSSSSKNYVKATEGKTYIRKEPNLEGKILKTLPQDETATYMKEKSTDERGVVWYKVKYDGTTGWVSSKYTTLSDKSGGNSNVSGEYVRAIGKTNIRREPNLDGKAVDIMYKDETATFTGTTSVDERGVVWYNIRFEGANGWVSSKYTVVE